MGWNYLSIPKLQWCCRWSLEMEKRFHSTPYGQLTRQLSQQHDCCPTLIHDDVIRWKHFPRYWPFVRGSHRPPVNSPHNGQGRGALTFSLICAWTNDWVNNREAGDLRRHRDHYDVTAMSCPNSILGKSAPGETYLQFYYMNYKGKNNEIMRRELIMKNPRVIHRYSGLLSDSSSNWPWWFTVECNVWKVHMFYWGGNSVVKIKQRLCKMLRR